MFSVKVIDILVVELIQELLLLDELELELLLALLSLLNGTLWAELILVTGPNEYLEAERGLPLFALSPDEHGVRWLVFLCFN